VRQHGGEVERRFWAEFGKRIRVVRRIRNIRQFRLAAELGVHRNTLMRCEKGEAISLWLAARICEQLGIQLDVMIRDLIAGGLRGAA